MSTQQLHFSITKRFGQRSSHPHEHRGCIGGGNWWAKNHSDDLSELADSDGVADLYPPDLNDAFRNALRQCPNVAMDPDVMEGQPCIAGTRIPVHSVLRSIEHYGSLDVVLKSYPQLTIPQVKDALYFAQIVLEPADGIEPASTAS